MQAPGSLVSSGGSVAEVEAVEAELGAEVEDAAGICSSSRSKSKSSSSNSSVSIGVGGAMAALNSFEAAGSQLTAAISTANLTEAAKSESTKAGTGEAVAPDLVKATRADLDFLDLDFMDLDCLDLDFLDLEADLEADLAKLIEAVWVAMVER